MYNYEWDKETGGYILLPTKITGVTKEVRPVFFEELRILEFDKKFGWFIPECDEPLMWAEGRRYIYKGDVVAEVLGGGLYDEPNIKCSVNNIKIEPVNINKMIQKNHSIMDGVIQTTLKYIYDIYLQNNKKDMIYVAFSGGKDSIVLLDLVQRALPHDKFVVVFADTTMEMSDTYTAVKEAQTRWNTLKWIIAKSHLDSKDTWKLIGPPAERMRWCCSIHKTAPQVLAIKNYVKKDHFKTLVYVGVRAEESEARSNYDQISESKKHIMQTSCCPILKWNTSELFLYMFENSLFLNRAYRKGFTRAGCMFCPMSSNWSYMMNKKINPEIMDEYVSLISDMSNISFNGEEGFKKYFNDTNWKLRHNGRDLKTGESRVIEIYNHNSTEFVLLKKKTAWQTWFNCIGELYSYDVNKYDITFQDLRVRFEVIEEKEFTKFIFPMLPKTKTTIRFMYLLKNALNKSAYCIGCKVCEVECPIGALKIEDTNVTNENCIHCGHCIDRDSGCIVAQSLVLPRGGNKMEKKNIAGYQTRGLRQDWLEIFFDYNSGADFWCNERMGPNMFLAFKTWLRDAQLLNGDTPTQLCMKLNDFGSDSFITWGVIYANLAYYSPLINWNIKNLDFEVEYDNSSLYILLGDQYTPTVKKSAVSSLKETFKASPLGEEYLMAMTSFELKGKTILSLTKHTWLEPDPIVILYTLYLFAEHMDGLYSFTLTDLLDDSEEREGLSPRIIFGIDRDTLKPILQGLANNYSDFIQVDFNKGIMENIDLPAGKNGKKALDVLSLI